MRGESTASVRPAGHGSTSVANLFLDWADELRCRDLTPLKLQKLLYFCHADLLLSKNTPLVRDEFEAWSYGPVIPQLYTSFKHFGSSPIRGRCQEFDPLRATISEPRAQFNPLEHDLVRGSFQVYVEVPGGVLSSMSHAVNGPWWRALEAFKHHRNINRRISNALILESHRRARG